ncbi:DUF4232 domain-containing protein [Arthrobacter sp.]|uniref:DUF4232 domain-containing protein n=1 Tax=Arthrobacter sp. TaxID=1667 RepID=UPI0028114070|nr:DUF4232 domain-containing protein [Arthrobacter sp.]
MPGITIRASIPRRRRGIVDSQDLSRKGVAMRSQRISIVSAVMTAAGAVLLLTACGPSQPQSQQTTPAASPSSSSSSAAPSETSPPSSPPAASTPTAGETPLCQASNLTASTDSSGGGAAGSINMQLVLKNSGSTPCMLRGFPGVSLTADAGGEPIGAPATRDESTRAADVVLAPGAAGTAPLRYTQAGNFQDCTLTPAAGYRIYPPEDKASLFIPQPTDACGNAAVTLLSVGAFRAQ